MDRTLAVSSGERRASYVRYDLVLTSALRRPSLALELVLSPSVGRAFVDLRDRRPLLPAAVIRLRCYASQPRTGARPSESVLPNLDEDALWDDVESTVEWALSIVF